VAAPVAAGSLVFAACAEGATGGFCLCVVPAAPGSTGRPKYLCT